MLALLCVVFPQPSVEVGGVKLYFPSLSSVLESREAGNGESADEMLTKVETTLQIPVVVDSAQLAWQDTLSFYTEFFAANAARIVCPDNDSSFLFPLFDALEASHEVPMHIFHYGDSQIEGDRISGYLRTQLQQKFSGSGPGVLPFVQPIGATSVAQSCSDSVASYYAGGMMGGRASHNRYGAMAQMSKLACCDTVCFSVSARRARGFRRVMLFAGTVDSALQARIGSNVRHLPKGENIETMTWHFASPRNKFDMHICGSAEIYGVLVDGGSGVTITNVPMRGSDGTFFTRIEKKGIGRMLQQLNTRLIIMEFGGNALPYLNDSTGVRRFCRGFAKQLDYMKGLCPEAKVLVIGPADMSTKIDGELQSHPMLAYLVDHLCETSTAAGAAYWDMYGVMGGHNSMIAWVKHQPSWAAPDYIHFTTRGADRISKVLWQSLMVYYDYRNLLNQKSTICNE